MLLGPGEGQATRDRCMPHLGGSSEPGRGEPASCRAQHVLGPGPRGHPRVLPQHLRPVLVMGCGPQQRSLRGGGKPSSLSGEADQPGQGLGRPGRRTEGRQATGAWGLVQRRAACPWGSAAQSCSPWPSKSKLGWQNAPWPRCPRHTLTSLLRCGPELDWPSALGDGRLMEEKGQGPWWPRPGAGNEVGWPGFLVSSSPATWPAGPLCPGPGRCATGVSAKRITPEH